MTTNRQRFTSAILAMEANAFRVGVVARRLLAEHDELPQLTSLRPMAREEDAVIHVQPSMKDVDVWARRLGIELSVRRQPDPLIPDQGREHAGGTTTLDGVTIELGAVRFIAAEEWAAMTAAASESAPESGAER